ETLISPKVRYKTIKHLTQVDGTLYGASVSEELDSNYQKYANLFKLKWTSTLLDFNQTNYKEHSLRFYNRTFKHGEVYAFYIRFKLKDGALTNAFHIPGRSPVDLVGGLTERSKIQDLITLGYTTHNFVPLSNYFQIASNPELYQVADTTRNIENTTIYT